MVNGRYDYSLPAETSKSLYSELWGPRRTKNATSSWKPAMSRPTTWWWRKSWSGSISIWDR